MKLVAPFILSLTGLAILHSCPAHAQSPNQVHYNPANGHHYRFVLFPARTWEQARVAAEGMMYQGVQGHLATITSAEEQAFVQQIHAGFGGSFWLGGFQPPGSPEPGSNWQWVTGEPFTYTNWYPPAEPNNAWNEENRIEVFDRNYFWNDLGDLEGSPSSGNRRPNTRSYLVEFPTPEPSSASLLVLAMIAMPRLTRQPGRGLAVITPQESSPTPASAGRRRTRSKRCAPTAPGAVSPR